ncbi:MAG: MBL fold metallo-hydrolase [Lachnospiraceae bacterium]|nr:MBL fold metallo-hydrolase [Lachnospiraceae bacterium]
MYLMLIIVIFVAIIALAAVWPMCFMHPLPSGKVEGTDITAIKNRSNNLFFIPAGENWIVIDAGSDSKAVQSEMGHLSIDAGKVLGVFLTHTDYDHVASLPLFSNATIYMSEQEKQMIDGSTYRQLIKKNKLPRVCDADKVVYLSDNEVVELGGHRVRSIWVPGHTKGSALYAVDEKYLFAGDAFKADRGRMTVHPYTMDRRQADESISKIENECSRYEKVFTAHYGIL